MASFLNSSITLRVETAAAGFSSPTHICISSIRTPCESGKKQVNVNLLKPLCVISNGLSLHGKSLKVATGSRCNTFQNSSNLCWNAGMARFTSPAHLGISLTPAPCEFGLKASQCKPRKLFCIYKGISSHYISRSIPDFVWVRWAAKSRSRAERRYTHCFQGKY